MKVALYYAKQLILELIDKGNFWSSINIQRYNQATEATKIEKIIYLLAVCCYKLAGLGALMYIKIIYNFARVLVIIVGISNYI